MADAQSHRPEQLPRALARAWRRGNLSVRRDVEREITARQLWQHFRMCDLYTDGSPVLISIDTAEDRAARLGASARSMLKRHDRETYQLADAVITQVFVRAVEPDVALIYELTGDAPLSETRLHQIETAHMEAL